MSPSYLPFLYQTRTILKSRQPAFVSLQRLLHSSPWLGVKREAVIPFVRDEHGDIPMEKRPVPGTITPQERRAFDRIFADIASRGLKPNVRMDLPPLSETARRSTQLILKSAAQEAGHQLPNAATSPALYTSAAVDKNKYLLRFPPSLRAAAEKAYEVLKRDGPPQKQRVLGESIGDAEEVEEWEPPQHGLLRMTELESKRWPVLKRVEKLILDAKSDWELWEIMEKEVFTFPDKLGLNSPVLQDQPVKELEQGKRNRKRNMTATEEKKPVDAVEASKETSVEVAEKAAESEESEKSEEDGTMMDPAIGPKLSLYVYGPLYPEFLLMGLRRLDSGFTHPSRLALRVLPRIKELGLVSFVLGVSTPLYNELLNIYYTRYGDLAKMLDLLEEMRHAGLWLDGETSAVLNKTLRHTTDLSKLEVFGPFSAALMTMPEYEPSLRDRIRHWASAVDISIAEKARDINRQQLKRI